MNKILGDFLRTVKLIASRHNRIERWEVKALDGGHHHTRKGAPRALVESTGVSRPEIPRRARSSRFAIYLPIDRV